MEQSLEIFESDELDFGLSRNWKARLSIIYSDIEPFRLGVRKDNSADTCELRSLC